jgi:hypothetical protein
MREALLGSRLPLPAALVDCGGGPLLCGGEDGCQVPAGRVMAAETAALAVPVGRMPQLEQDLFILTREVLRAAREGCSSGPCPEVDDRLLRAAATQVMRRLEAATAHALDLPQGAVFLMVDGLLALDGDESGPGTFPWWDGTWKGVADLQVLTEALASLSQAADHVPSLLEHPYPEVLDGLQEWTSAAGLCARLPVYLEAAMLRAGERAAAGAVPPQGEAVEIIDAPRIITNGGVLAGEGVLIIQDTLTIAEGGQLTWKGSVVLHGGVLSGTGSMQIQGSLLIMARSGSAALDLATAGLHLQGDLQAHRQAWGSAGNILLSAWFGPGGP